MNEPVSPANGATFDLASISQELRQEAAYAREGQTARTLIRTDDMRVVLIVLKAGKRIASHAAHVTATVYVFAGTLHVHLQGRTIDLGTGSLLALERDLEHDVQAETDSTFVMTLGWPGTDN